MRAREPASFWRENVVAVGRDPFNQNSDREKWFPSKGGPVFSKLFRLDRADPLSFGLKFPVILVEWIAPVEVGSFYNEFSEDVVVTVTSFLAFEVLSLCCRMMA